ncbi:hypothetical protein [Paraburkholderia sp. J67]|uniref:hypothetical protein n=1 Tax=Paraburkholderia sp. J67 TaxID=2805435 RepID=UPI002ABD484A|nr:hypothetical protein [Paraburkholderia sp. J67]
MKRFEYRIFRARDGALRAILDSPLGNGQEISPEELRKLANGLLEIADATERTKLGRQELWKSGVIELE